MGVAFFTRREFVARGLTVLSGAATLPLFLSRTATALADERPAAHRNGDSERILVVVQLAGGNDGLNTVIPHGNDLYYRYRPRLAIPATDVLPVSEGIGLHPAATGLKALFDDGRLAIVQGVGYPNPNRSHFVSMDVWHAADPELRRPGGWLGRYFDACCAGADPPDPLLGLALLPEAPLALQGRTFMPMALEDPAALRWRAGERDPDAAAVFARLNNRDGATTPATQPTTRAARAERRRGAADLRQFLQRAALDAQIGAEELRAAAGAELTGARRRRRAAGGNALAHQLTLVGRMLRAELPTRIYYVALGGFDTHSGQLARQQQLLRAFGDALRDFLDALAADRLADRVLVLCFSEFGRRVQENASGGTDHGAAAPVFLAGPVVAGLHAAHPDLARLDRGDLAFGCDFRRIYATVLRDWLGTPPEPVLGSGFAPLRLVAS